MRKFVRKCVKFLILRVNRGDGRSRTAVQTTCRVGFYILILPLVVGRRLPAGGPSLPYPLSLGVRQGSRHVQPSWMISRVQAIEGGKSCGILVAAALGRAIKEPYLVRLRSECIVVVASYGLCPRINELRAPFSVCLPSNIICCQNQNIPMLSNRAANLCKFPQFLHLSGKNQCGYV